MRIAYLANSILPSRSANSIQVMKMCHAFAALGHSVTLFAQQGSVTAAGDVAGIFKFYGVAPVFQLRLSRLPRLKGMSLVSAAFAVPRIRGSKPDLVYSRSLWGAALSLAAGMTTTLEIHEFASFQRPIHRRVLRFVAGHAKLRRLVTISAVLRDDLIAAYPAAASRAVVAHDAADPVRLARGDASAAPGPLKVGYVGHLYPGKGFEMVPLLARRAPYAVFHVVGGDPDTVAGFESSGHLPGNVVMHGFKPYLEAEEIRLGCDVLIAPFQKRIAVTSEGASDIARWTSPLKIFEYMASGKPILCSDLPVLREVLEHERTALLLPPEDADAWADGLQRIAADRELGLRLGAAAKERFMKKHTWQMRAEAVL